LEDGVAGEDRALFGNVDGQLTGDVSRGVEGDLAVGVVGGQRLGGIRERIELADPDRTEPKVSARGPAVHCARLRAADTDATGS
jgi:hypothetical protein